MNLEDIKVGDVYNVRVRVVDVDDDTGEITTETANENGYALGFEWCYYAPGEALAFSPISAENGIKNTEPAPKYDPCRRFRKGDEVEYHPKDDRELFEAKRLLAQRLTVVENEHEEYNRVAVKAQNGDILSVPFYYLKLVTPVEERVSFRVGDFSVNGEWSVWKDSLGKTEIISSYKIDTHPNAKKAAEAERDRLNAEHRKENSHE